jgi:hypothetical protein
VRDQEKNCPWDLAVDFVEPALGLSDLDGDGAGELTFAYQLDCASDVSPATLKLLVLEGPDKYILRGRTRVDVGGGETVGGDAEPDEAMRKSPFRAHAEKVWAKLLAVRE